MKVIGLGHYSRTGKDTFANYLVEKLNTAGVKARKMPFAWKLKAICHDLYAWDGLREPEFYETKEGEKFRDIKLPTIGKTPVEIWIDMGTPAVRENVYMETWVDYVLRGDHGVDVLVIPDVRFINEVEAVRGCGGQVIKVVRPGYGPRASVADRALVGWDGWDYVIGSSGKMSELEAEAALWAGCIGSSTTLPRHSKHYMMEVCSVEDIKPWTPPAGWEVPAWYPPQFLETLAA